MTLLYKLAAVAIILAGISGTFIYFGVSQYLGVLQSIATDEQMVRDGRHSSGYPSMSFANMDVAIKCFAVAAAFGAGSVVVFLMYRYDRKHAAAMKQGSDPT